MDENYRILNIGLRLLHCTACEISSDYTDVPKCVNCHELGPQVANATNSAPIVKVSRIYHIFYLFGNFYQFLSGPDSFTGSSTDFQLRAEISLSRFLASQRRKSVKLSRPKAGRRKA